MSNNTPPYGQWMINAAINTGATGPPLQGGQAQGITIGGLGICGTSNNKIQMMKKIYDKYLKNGNVIPEDLNWIYEEKKDELMIKFCV